MKNAYIAICAIFAMMSMTIACESTQTCEDEKQQVEEDAIKRGLLSSIGALNITLWAYEALPDACKWYRQQFEQFLQTDFLLSDGSRVPAPDATWGQIGAGYGVLIGLFCVYGASYYGVYKGIKALEQKLNTDE